MNVYLRPLKKALQEHDLESGKKIVRDFYVPEQPSKEAEILKHLYDACNDYLEKYGEVLRYYHLIRKDQKSIRELIDDLQNSFRFLHELMSILHLHPHTLKSMNHFKKEIERLRDAIDVHDEFYQKTILREISHGVLSKRLFRHEMYDLVMSLIIFYNLLYQSLNAKDLHTFELRVKTAINAFDNVQRHIVKVVDTEEEIELLHQQFFKKK
jgi:hypothetical protein